MSALAASTLRRALSASSSSSVRHSTGISHSFALLRPSSSRALATSSAAWQGGRGGGRPAPSGRPPMRSGGGVGARGPGARGGAEAVNPLTTRNHDIPFERAHLVDAESGGLRENVRVAEIVASLDLKTHALACVQTQPPIVKIVDLSEERARAREHESKVRLAKRLATEDKELQMGWGAADGDVHHKVEQAKALLEKGDRVHVVFALRASAGGKRQKIPDTRRAEILALFESGLADIATKWKEDEIQSGLWIQYWKPIQAISAEARNKVLHANVEKKKNRDEKKEARRLKEEERLRKARERQILGEDHK